MTPIADMVADMMARGVPAEVIVLAVRTAELAQARAVSAPRPVDSPVDIAAEKRRAWDRERRRRERACPPDSTGLSTGHPPDSENRSSSLSLDQERKKEGKKERKKERARGKPLPPDWQPNVGHMAAGRQLGFNDQQIGEQAEDMRLWARSNEHRQVAKKVDWDMAFLGWMRRNKPKGSINGKRYQSPAEAAIAHLDQQIARNEGANFTLDLGPGEYSSGRYEGS